MKTLFVIHTPRDPKTAIYRGYSLRKDYFTKMGSDAEILSPDDFPWLKTHARFIAMIYPFLVCSWILKRKQQFRLVVFHSYSGWVFNLMKSLFLKKQELRTITAFHGVEPLFFRELVEEEKQSGNPTSLRFRLFYCFFLVRMIRMSCRRSDHVFCLNTTERDYLVEQGYVSSDKVCILTNDVPKSFFIAREYAQEAQNLLFVGQWLNTKGTRYLIESFKELSEEFPSLRLYLVGTIQPKEIVLKEVPKELHESIVVRPKLMHDEMKEAYERADIFIFPSVFEAFSRALTEALAAGLPVISTPVGAGADWLKDRKNCLLIPKRDSKAIVECVKYLVRRPDERKLLGEAAQNLVKGFENQDSLHGWWESCYPEPKLHAA